jgi:hypothetical protein
MLLESRMCANEDWEGTVRIEFWDLVKQLQAQGIITDFKINGMHIDLSKREHTNGTIGV